MPNSLTQSTAFGPTKGNKYTGTIRYYYRAQFESSVMAAMNEVISNIQNSGCQYTFDPIVR